ncbi:DUF4113 domain-containing protein [Pseudomonas sp. BIGb0427]|uniref:DUF4113 domain-containing protein n=1 Tax=Pseudomonas sp. BIGb0427 TaxID=2724470 RepID=UPI002DD8FA7C|nr:DUF4113 domain-containing protein [Pseudomonas sp. BIGb0427]
MGVLDTVNSRWGRGTMRLASVPVDPSWGIRREMVSVRRTHLPDSSFKGDGVRVFLSGRDHPYRQDLHAPTKLLPVQDQHGQQHGQAPQGRRGCQRRE